MMGDDKIIRFPGAAKPATDTPAADKPLKVAAARPPLKDSGKNAAVKGAFKPAADPVLPGLEHLSEAQRKAIGIVLSGMPFVTVGLKPTVSGADFFTAVGGDATDLHNAEPHLAAVISRAIDRYDPDAR
jgi:hypothetical protein